jgi:archaellum component FlaF (FlaF/FlaG flagellin family)
MKKIDLIGMAVAGVLVFLVLGLVFFQKEGKGGKGGSPTTPGQSTPNPGGSKTPGASQTDAEAQRQAEAIVIQEKGAGMIVNFVEKYNSFTYGDFTNIKNLYLIMSPSLRQTEEDKVRALEDTLVDIPYRTVISAVTSSDLESYEESNGKMVMRLTINKVTYNGAYVPENNSDPYGPTKLVDSRGKRYSGRLESLRANEEIQVYRVTAFYAAKQWQIAAMQRVS